MQLSGGIVPAFVDKIIVENCELLPQIILMVSQVFRSNNIVHITVYANC